MPPLLLFRLSVIAFAFGLGCTAAIAQTRSAPDGKTGSRTETAHGAPIRIEKRRPTLNGETSEDKVGVLFHNTTQKPIRAFAWVTETGSDRKLAVSLYNKGQKPDLILLGSIFPDHEDPQFTFDWVLFVDGSTWGADEYGRSQEILGYFKGFQAAAARAAELAGEANAAGLMAALDGPWQTSWSIELPLITSRGEKDHFRKGYDIVVSRLQYDPEIAKLELPKDIIGQMRKELNEKQGGNSHR